MQPLTAETALASLGPQSEPFRHFSAAGMEGRAGRGAYLALCAVALASRAIAAADGREQPSSAEALHGDWFEDASVPGFADATRELVSGLGDGATAALKSVSIGAGGLDPLDAREDVLKPLHAALLAPVSRRQRGEFYTPDWLARRIVRRVLDATPAARLIDPACGSGTFLFAAIRAKLERRGAGTDRVRHVLESVHGADVDPLAVLLARATYLLALGHALRDRPSRLWLPVTLADLLGDPPPHGCYDAAVGNPPWVPIRTLAPVRQAHVRRIATDYGLAGRRGELAPHLDLSSLCVARTADRLVRTGGAVAFVLPRTFMSADQYDALRRGTLALANGATVEWAELWDCEGVRPLFTVPACVVFARPGLNHEGWCLNSDSSDYSDYADTAARSLRNPANPTDPSSDEWRGPPEHRRPGIPGLRLRGSMSRSSASDDSCERAIVAEPVTYRLTIAGRRSWWASELREAERDGGRGQPLNGRGKPRPYADEYTTPTTDRGGEAVFGTRNSELLTPSVIHPLTPSPVSSPYRSRFAQGATIVPRSCWIVEPEKAVAQGGFVRVATAPERRAGPVRAYSDVRLEGCVPSRYLFAVLSGDDVLPFAVRSCRAAVLPLVVAQGRSRLLEAAEARAATEVGLAEWLAAAERVWADRRADKSARMSIYQRLDRVRGLTRQDPHARWRVAYPNFQRVAVASVVAADVPPPGGERCPGGVVIDTALYVCETADEAEAHYLCAVLNAPATDRRLGELRRREQRAHPNVHKKLFDAANIPAFDPEDPRHRALVDLGASCAATVAGALVSVDAALRGSLGSARRATRELVARDMAEIDRLAEQLFCGTR